MMYDSKMVLAVKANGRILRESREQDSDNATVFLPFGCEYKLVLKNLHHRKALMKIEIDGTDVGDGQQFVLEGGESVDLERFIKNGNMSSGNRFKFIEKTAGVEAHRGNKVEDGLIRVQFEYARETPFYRPTLTRGMDIQGARSGELYSKGIGSNASYSGGDVAMGAASASASSFNMDALDGAATMDWMDVEQPRGFTPQNQDGITVPGSISNQQFKTTAWFATDGIKHTMVLKMMGEVEGQVVKQPLTVNTKLECTSCGKSHASSAKFCDACGTGLHIV